MLPPEPKPLRNVPRWSKPMKASLSTGPVCGALVTKLMVPPTAPWPELSEEGPFRNSTRSRLKVSIVSAVNPVGPMLMPL